MRLLLDRPFPHWMQVVRANEDSLFSVILAQWFDLLLIIWNRGYRGERRVVRHVVGAPSARERPHQPGELLCNESALYLSSTLPDALGVAGFERATVFRF